jgi:ketosteroid isomerase-like protein
MLGPGEWKGEEMSEHPHAVAVRRALEAFSKGELDVVAASIEEDAVWHVPGTNRFAGTFTGREAILGRFAKMAEAGLISSFDDIHDVVGNDDHVVALVQLTLTAPGGSVTGNSVQVYHVRDGRAAEFWAINEHQAAFDELIGS